MRYYFICYQWKTCGGDHLIVNDVLDCHPLKFLKDYYNHPEEYRLISWQEISKEEFIQFHDFAY